MRVAINLRVLPVGNLPCVDCASSQCGTFNTEISVLPTPTLVADKRTVFIKPSADPLY